MQKAIITSPVLSVATSSDITNKQMETHLYVIREHNQIEKNSASHLHRLLFGKKKLTALQTVAYENKAGEPDYFSSYE